jgi:hypothetical protein
MVKQVPMLGLLPCARSRTDRPERPHRVHGAASELLDRYVLSAVRLAQLASPSLPVSTTFRFQVADGPPAR